MNHKLWKATFPPVNPVCAGELIFTTPLDMQEGAALIIATTILDECDINEVSSLNYLGEIIPGADLLESGDEYAEDIYIVTLQTGDY